MDVKEKKKTSAMHKVWTVVGIIMCIVLIPMLVMNVTLIVKSYVSPDSVPAINGYTPMIVLTDSMYPDIKSGDLIIAKTIEADQVQVGDVITFYDPASKNNAVVTHKVVELTEVEGELAFITQGVANNAPDEVPVPAENLIGVYQTRIAGVGHVAMFMQTTPGLILCVGVPLLLLIGYDILRRKAYEKASKKDTDALLAELEALKAAQAAAEAAPAAVGAESSKEEE